MSNKDVVVGVGIERCGKINAVNSGSESWTGIGVVAGCAAVWLITQGPHVKDMAMYERITFLHILQEVRGIGKTCNQLSLQRYLTIQRHKISPRTGLMRLVPTRTRNSQK